MNASARTARAALLEEYTAALGRFLHGGGEAALSSGYDLGRRAVAEGYGVLELSELHQRALATQILGIAHPAQVSALVYRASAFFGECLAPFEIIHSGYREANARLRTLNETLEEQVRKRTEELLAERNAAEEEQARHLREAQEGVKARDTFLSIASHELRTPLTALRLLIDYLVRHAAAGLAPERLRELKAVERQSKRLERLFANLLAVSHITAGKIQLDLEVLDLAEVARDVVASLREELAQAGCAVSVSAPAPVVGSWDRTRIEQVVTNLLSNAAKYGGGLPVEVIVERGPSSASLVVRDRGIGIDAEDLERIFGRFERAVSVRHYGGFGLGLWIVQQIVSALGGSIRAESRPGQGSTFTVELPL